MGETTYAIMRSLPEVLQDAAVKAHLARKRRGLKHLQTPTAIILYVTNKCNLRCGHCFYWDSLNTKTPELTIEQVDKLVASLAHPVSLSLTGGEPFMRKDLAEMVQCFMAPRKAKEVAVATSGYYTRDTVEFCRQFLARYADTPLSVQISLDGLRDTHDAIRGIPTSFDRALATMDNLVELAGQHSALSVACGVAIQKRNLGEISELIDLLAARKVEIRINLIRGETAGTFGVTLENSSHFDPKDGNSIALDVEEMHALHALLTAKNELHGFWSKRHQRSYEIGMEVIEHRKKVIDCWAGTIDGVIYPNGDVAFCELTRVVGNLHDYDFDLKKLWHTAQAVAMRDNVTRCFCTHGCNISTNLLMSDPAIVKEAVLGTSGARRAGTT